MSLLETDKKSLSPEPSLLSGTTTSGGDAAAFFAERSMSWTQEEECELSFTINGSEPNDEAKGHSEATSEMTRATIPSKSRGEMVEEFESPTKSLTQKTSKMSIRDIFNDSVVVHTPIFCPTAVSPSPVGKAESIEAKGERHCGSVPLVAASTQLQASGQMVVRRYDDDGNYIPSWARRKRAFSAQKAASGSSLGRRRHRGDESPPKKRRVESTATAHSVASSGRLTDSRAASTRPLAVGSTVVDLTPAGSLRDKRTHRLGRKSKTALLLEVLLGAEVSDGVTQAFDGEHGCERDLSKEELAVCKRLLNAGADAMRADSDGRNALWALLHFEGKNAVALLCFVLKQLQLAIRHSQSSSLILLRTAQFTESGSAQHCDWHSASILDTALRVANKAAVRVLLKYGEVSGLCVFPTLHSATVSPSVELLTFARHCDDRMKASAIVALRKCLWHGVVRFDADCVRTALCHGCAVDARPIGHCTQTQTDCCHALLHCLNKKLSSDCQLSVIKELCQYGANANSRDEAADGLHVLCYLIPRTSQRARVAVQTLLEYGCDVRSRVSESDARSLFEFSQENAGSEHIRDLIQTKFHYLCKR